MKTRLMGLSFSIAQLLAVPLALTTATAKAADEPTAREIMQQVKDRDTGNNATMDLTMILVDSKGNTRNRELRSYQRDDPTNPDDSQSIMFFIGPANVEGTGFLTYDYDSSDRDDDQWLYLPALQKVKRIAAADKSGSFMGSDFTYADMSSPDLDDYDYELMGEKEVNGHPTWQILATPNNDAERERTGYSKSVSFIRKDILVPVRSVSWVENGGKLKYMDVKSLEKIDGIWTSTEITMTTRKGKQTEHASVLRFSDVKYNQSLDDDLFTERRLTKGL